MAFNKYQSFLRSTIEIISDYLHAKSSQKKKQFICRVFYFEIANIK